MRLKILAIATLILFSGLVQAKIIKLECVVPSFAVDYIVLEIDTTKKTMTYVHTESVNKLTITAHQYIGKKSSTRTYVDRTNLKYRNGNHTGQCKIFKLQATLI